MGRVSSTTTVYARTSGIWAGGSDVRTASCVHSKVFRGRDIALLDAQLKLVFKDVVCSKPRSSRNSSIGQFLMCVL